MSLQVRNSLESTGRFEPIDKTQITLQNEKSASIAVFHKLKELVSNTSLCEKIICRINEDFIHYKGPHNELMTCCSVNAYLLNLFFVGEAQTDRIFKFLNLSLSGQFKGVINYYHLISGNALLDLKSKFQDPSFEYSNENLELIRKDFDEYKEQWEQFHTKTAQMYLNRKIDPTMYDYNNNVINRLESEINGNKNKVSRDCSFIYHVHITEPPPSVSSKGCVEDILNAPLGYFHAFVLEHFYDPEKNTDCIRLHQSWINEFTISEHYEKHATGGIIDGSDFCKNLKGMHTYDDSITREKLKRCQFACFNVLEDIELGGVFRTDINLFTGRSVRYVTTMINPNDCLKNIEDIITKYGV